MTAACPIEAGRDDRKSAALAAKRIDGNGRGAATIAQRHRLKENDSFVNL